MYNRLKNCSTNRLSICLQYKNFYFNKPNNSFRLLFYLIELLRTVSHSNKLLLTNCSINFSNSKLVPYCKLILTYALLILINPQTNSSMINDVMDYNILYK